MLSAVAALAGVLALAGCGGTTPADPLKAVAKATKTTLSQPLVADLVLQGSNLYGKPHTSVTGRGAFAFDTGIGYERIDLLAEPGHAAGREYLDLLPTAFAFERASATGQLVPFNGKTWVSVPLTGARSIETIVPGFALQAEGLSPQLFLDELAWGAVSAAKLGSPVINHVPQAEYRVSVNLKQALTMATGAMATAIKNEAAASGSSTVSINVWVDGPGLILKLEGPVPGSGLGTVEFDLGNFGVKIPTSTPAASTVLKIDAKTPAGADLFRSVWIFS